MLRIIVETVPAANIMEGADAIYVVKDNRNAAAAAEDRDGYKEEEQPLQTPTDSIPYSVSGSGGAPASSTSSTRCNYI